MRSVMCVAPAFITIFIESLNEYADVTAVIAVDIDQLAHDALFNKLEYTVEVEMCDGAVAARDSGLNASFKADPHECDRQIDFYIVTAVVYQYAEHHFVDVLLFGENARRTGVFFAEQSVCRHAEKLSQRKQKRYIRGRKVVFPLADRLR